MWWYGSYRHQDIKARFVNFPVKPQTTILNNYSVKLTYNLSQNHKLIGYTQPSQKKQPQRFDSFLLGVDTGINTSEETTWNQNFWAWVHKVEWNAVLSDNAFVGGRGGQYGYDWTNGVNGTGLRYEDIGNNLIYGRNRNWARERRRGQDTRYRSAPSRTGGPAITISRPVAKSSTKPSSTSMSMATKKTSCTSCRMAQSSTSLFPGAKRGHWRSAHLRHLPDRYVAAERPADGDRSPPVRPLSCVSPGAGARRGSLQSRADHLQRAGQRGHVQPVCPETWRDLRRAG